MPKWTAEERSTIQSVWQKVNIEQDGLEALDKMITVYPWTQKFKSNFRISTPAAIAGNVKVQEHTRRFLGAIGETVKNLDNVKSSLQSLSDIHSHELFVDPNNFYFEMLVNVMADRLGPSFTPRDQSAIEKFFDVMADGLSNSNQN
uniref:Globin domain-containing protein n=1 Tax=Pyxicephalus adspersus TaxID=30357 RepID=A0AAV3A325_PYXAD|nr:TPA: hypothetical protein GDO54_015908 [Pyxicephalus adspersus]